MTNSSSFNESPQTDQDFWIVKGVLLSIGLTTANPKNGVHIKPTRPASYQHETKGPGIIVGCTVCIFFMLLVTGTRLYLRKTRPSLYFGIDDWLIIPALVLAVAYPSIQIAMVSCGGAGQHIYDVTYHEYYIYHWLAAVAQIDFFICVGLIKMSIAVFNVRLTGMVTSRVWRTSNWIFLGLVLAYIVIAFFINVFQCVPAITSFDYIAIGQRGVQPKCLGVAKINTILRVINIVLDYCLLTVPIIMVWSLQMSFVRKLRIAAVFAFGALACIGSVMALIAKSQLKTDALWNYTSLLAWTLVELLFGIIAASLPALACLWPTRTSSTDDSGNTADDKTHSTFRSRARQSMQDRASAFKLRMGADDESMMPRDYDSACSMTRSSQALLRQARWTSKRCPTRILRRMGGSCAIFGLYSVATKAGPEAAWLTCSLWGDATSIQEGRSPMCTVSPAMGFRCDNAGHSKKYRLMNCFSCC